jgi:hypothetical protein
MTVPNQTTTRDRDEPLSTADIAAVAERHTEATAERHTEAAAERRTEMASDTPSEPATTSYEREAGVAVERKPADRATSEQRRTPLFATTDAEDLRSKWSDIQAGFVDEPRRSVEQADGLVVDVMQRLAAVFATERRDLEQQWDSGAQSDTEQLRQALQRYRSFFERLLAL